MTSWRRALPAAAAVVPLVVVAVVAGFVGGGSSGSGRYEVSGNRILDPAGRPFVVRGVTLLYGTFAGGDEAGLGARNFAAARADLRRVRALGANTVRIMVTPAAAHDVGRLRRAVGWARAEGLVVVLANAFAGPAESLPWLALLARTFGADPGVWYAPMNEPNCAPQRPTCGDWTVWQREQQAYVDALRTAGAHAPIVVNTPGWSASLRGLARHPLEDADLVYGVHRYGNERSVFDAAAERRAWADEARRRAVVVEEIGGWNGPGFVNAPAWLAGFVGFLRGWVASEHGAGAIGFVWRWSDPNTMVGPDERLTPWGRLFADGFLR